MDTIGLQTKIDHFGNVIGRMAGVENDAPALVIGSHIDSQPYGGRYDGALGVIGALEVLESLYEQGITPNIPIVVIAFADEEGSRFNKGLFGVRGMLDLLEEGELERQDKTGMTRRKALIEFGCDPSKFEECLIDTSKIAAFLELHIEQGPVLEAKEEPIGIVTGLWMTVEMEGPGSVPMAMILFI
ncbi:M20/M25/M40 family metallo-hydrolase [Sporosarcina sp. GW1-11]|uniref:M20/M25/M40 family metallo-hydrolase n=1 Tax=Sporosarcina sp. GW1-11 TaxID=2899126 RepID=UPI002953A44D|nr:M20/M25/M40 family metallo-hydrolase [Sporosarcina sp. GW1-11]